MKEEERVVTVAFMGAPTVWNEKLANGNEILCTMDSMQDLYRVGLYADGSLHNTGMLTDLMLVSLW